MLLKLLGLRVLSLGREARPPDGRSRWPKPRFPSRFCASPRGGDGAGRGRREPTARAHRARGGRKRAPRQSGGAGLAGARRRRAPRPLTCRARRSRASAAGPRRARAAAPTAAAGRAAWRGRRQRRGARAAPGPRRGARQPGASPFSPPRLRGRRTRGPRGERRLSHPGPRPPHCGRPAPRAPRPGPAPCLPGPELCCRATGAAAGLHHVTKARPTRVEEVACAPAPTVRGPMDQRAGGRAEPPAPGRIPGYGGGGKGGRVKRWLGSASGPEEGEMEGWAKERWRDGWMVQWMVSQTHMVGVGGGQTTVV